MKCFYHPGSNTSSYESTFAVLNHIDFLLISSVLLNAACTTPLENVCIVPHKLEWQREIYPWKQGSPCLGPLALTCTRCLPTDLLSVFKCARSCMCAIAGQPSRWPRFTACQRTPLPVWKQCALKRSARRTTPCFSSFTHTPLYPLLFLFHFSFMFILLSALFCIYEHVIN